MPETTPGTLEIPPKTGDTTAQAIAQTSPVADQVGLLYHDVLQCVVGRISNPTIAEDITGNIIFAAVKGEKTFRGQPTRENVGHWLFGIMLRQIADYYSSENSKPEEVSLDQLQDTRSKEVAAQSDIKGNACAATAEAQIASLVSAAKLTGIEWMVLRMRHLDENEQQFKDIAKTLGMPLETVKSHYYRARDKLRRQGLPSPLNTN